MFLQIGGRCGGGTWLAAAEVNAWRATSARIFLSKQPARTDRILRGKIFHICYLIWRATIKSSEFIFSPGFDGALSGKWPQNPACSPS
jgi:hypothetical protein